MSVVNPEVEAAKFQAMAQAILDQRVAVANLPEDLQVVAIETNLNAQAGMDACKTALELNHIVWQYKVCVITQLRVANARLKALETEAANRAAAANAEASVAV